MWKYTQKNKKATMKAYPLHIVNRLNTPFDAKQRIEMIYQRASSKANLVKYGALLMLALLAYSLFVFRSQLNRWLQQPNPSVINNVKELQPLDVNGHWYAIAQHRLTTNELRVNLKKGAYVAFGFPKKGLKEYPKAQLLDNNGKIISTNVKRGQVYFGFSYKAPHNGNYTLKMLNFRPGQTVHQVSQQSKMRKQIKKYEITTKQSRHKIHLSKGITYEFSLANKAPGQFGTLTIYQGQTPLANNVNNKGNAKQSFIFRCLKTDTYTIDFQTDKDISEIKVYTWNQ
ncbi:hypothetical protein BKI52_38525 [marine bacterium AO1-C]|nr:hypothetical protein BKI52_38525 [marine bacterium AO1-C]